MANGEWQVLLVEDEFDSLQMVSKILKFHGVEVVVAHHGAECMDLLDHLTPTLIVTDLAMPMMDGWQTLAAIRSNPRTRHIPVVAVTAYHSIDVAEEAMNAGFDGYFAKPVDPRSFVQSLGQILAG
ncbi:MAG: response regulator [Chloroflexi bacterium]|nr:response regulator [Chloroflexota bacterium]